MISALLEKIAGPVLDRILPDKAAREAARLELFKAQQEGEFRSVELQLSAIIREAKSKDPSTSRARPAFLYVMYAVILLCIGGGIIGIWFPDQVFLAANNIRELLNAIPDQLWWLFGTGYLGYTGARTLDKRGGLSSIMGDK